MKQDANKFIAYLAIIATPFALGAFVLAWSPAQQFSSENPAGDGYVPPRSIEKLVERTQESTVTVWCEPKGEVFSQGTAWAIELEKDSTKESPTVLITNHHVIDSCIDPCCFTKVRQCQLQISLTSLHIIGSRCSS